MVKQAFLVLSLTAALALSGCSRQQSDWEKTRASNTTDAYELFLKKYPSGEFTAQAKARVKELYEERDWQKARDTDTLDAYQAFLKQYPEGKWTEEARIRVENFTLASAPSNGTPSNSDAAPAADSTASAAPTKPAQTMPARGAEAGYERQESRACQNACGCQGLKDPMAYSSAHSSRARMPPTNVGRNSSRNTRKRCRGSRRRCRRRRARPARCIACKSPT